MRYEFRGLIHGGAYFRNFTVFDLYKQLRILQTFTEKDTNNLNNSSRMKSQGLLRGWSITSISNHRTDKNSKVSGVINYRKIPKISLGLIFFKGPFGAVYFWRGLYCSRGGLSTEGNLRFKIDWANLIVGSKFTVFALFYFIFEGNLPSTSPRGLIFGGAI